MHNTIKHLRNNIENNNALSEDDRNKLLELIKSLEAQAEELEKHPQSDQVREAIDAAGSVSQNITEEEDGSGLLDSLNHSIQAIEASHPRTAEALGRIGDILGRMGI